MPRLRRQQARAEASRAAALRGQEVARDQADHLRKVPASNRMPLGKAKEKEKRAKAKEKGRRAKAKARARKVRERVREKIRRAEFGTQTLFANMWAQG